ncbi:IS66-like element accessory protein TnpA [Reinekea marinisedimentorum]|uniref:Transposase n=1 Tax=Reinekea marinisedimentorum TaxID=230495 RepID=A0A4R3HRE3_9GAMM|nr:transposase [Reinekea marinisedimentorum]TCS34305.1 transposase [Reinekea marinisedimentorum]
MDQLSDKTLFNKVTAKRRKYTPEFRAKIVALCQEPGSSVAAIAQQYGLNANLVHKWRRRHLMQDNRPSSTAFLPIPVLAPEQVDSASQTVRFELNGLSVDWPLAHIDQAVPWLKALQS